jgi:replicative DNA helicase
MPETEPVQPTLYRLSSLVDEATADAEARYQSRQTGQLLGPITAIPSLTHQLGGSLTAGVHILHGSPGAGKTAFALQTAATCGFPALFVSCEMGPIELLRRIASRVTQTYLGKFKSGELTPSDARAAFIAAARSAEQLEILDATKAPLLPGTLETYARTLRDDHRTNSAHCMIVMDSIHSWASGWQSPISEYETLNEALDKIRQIASSLDMPALCVAERNRASMQLGGQSASAGSRRFEYGAESVIELNRNKDDSEPDSYGDIPVNIKVSKNRHGVAAGKIEVLFNGRTQRFHEA